MESPEVDVAFAPPAEVSRRVPITCVPGQEALGTLKLTARETAWVSANNFTGAASSALLLPDDNGEVARVLFGLGDPEKSSAPRPREHLVGRLTQILPPGVYELDPTGIDLRVATLAWGLGAYRYNAYRSGEQNRARLVLDETPDARRIRAMTSAIWSGRDLINRPANDLAPLDLIEAIRGAANRFNAELQVWAGDVPDFQKTFPLVHAVGAASTRPPQVAELTWGDPSAPSVTLAGKGITFDTGGLDIKPASGMRNMKKDMGGAAAALALACMLMELNVRVRLRLVVAAADNAIAGNAFRPGDIIKSRSGLTVEIGNTDAEGRLVLADALALADEKPADIMATFATLTGAARVALGPELPAMFVTDDTLADKISAAGLAVGDPVWRMPFWSGYDSQVDGQISDLRNVGDGPMGGAIFAGLFLKRFVKNARRFAHFDLFGWRASGGALGPAGGEIQVARAMLATIEEMAGER